MTMKELYKDVTPENPVKGKLGFYPAADPADYRELPLPLRCSVWDAEVEAVIFDTFFSNYGVSAKVEVHPDHAFKCLFASSGGGTQLYSVCAVRLKNGRNIYADWRQDTHSGAFAIFNASGKEIARQGGYQGWIPEECYKDEHGEWYFESANREDGKIFRYSA